jgi:prepilin-type N-terminal cleavage/methylation domain-containing protein
METSKSQIRRPSLQRGFSLLEAIIAISILAIGLLGVAALLSKLSATTTTSRYLGTEVTLASEKLEDLNRAPKGSLVAGGNLGGPDLAGYFDQVQISSDNGAVTDTMDGTAPPAATSDMLQFKRRWVIEQNQPVNGTLRITVIVIPLTGTAVERAQTFQTSLVRPL